MKTWKNIVEEDYICKRLIMAFAINSSGNQCGFCQVPSTSYRRLKVYAKSRLLNG